MCEHLGIGLVCHYIKSCESSRNLAINGRASVFQSFNNEQLALANCHVDGSSPSLNLSTSKEAVMLRLWAITTRYSAISDGASG